MTALAEAPDIERRNVARKRLSLRDEIEDVARQTHLLSRLVERDLTVRYKRSVLGVLWTMLNPLAMMIVLTIVFSTIFRFEIRHYEVYFLSQYLGWIFFSQTTTAAMSSLAWNGPLMKRVRIPKSIFALSATIGALVNLAISLAVLAAIMLVVGVPIRMAVVVLPLSVLLLACFTLGVSLGVSAVSVHFTDVRDTYQIFLMVLMYLTPIIYPVSIVPAPLRAIIEWNPLHHLLQMFRMPIYYGVLPTATDTLLSLVYAVVSLALGWAVFSRMANRFHIYM